MDQGNAGVRKRKRKENADARKRKRGGGAGGESQQDKAVAVAAVVGKVAECVQQEEEQDYEGITEESIREMMRWLALELAPPAGAGGVATAAGSSPQVAPAAGYVTVQGNMESCGPSFSGSASTVMASVDVRFVAPVPPMVPWPWPEAAAAGPQEEEVVSDEWVAGLLTDGPAEEAGWYGSGQS